MSLIAELVRKLGAAGCSIEQIAVAVELHEQERLAQETHKREVNAARQARYRDKRRPVASRNVTGRNEQLPPPTYTTPPEENSEPKKVPRSMRASPLSTDWKVSTEGRSFAQSHGWDPPRIEQQAERFRDHALAGGRKQVDWEAAWRKWVTSPYQSTANGARASPNGAAPRPGSREDRQEKTHNAYQKLRQYAHPQADDAGHGGFADDEASGLLPFAKPA